MTPLSNHFTPFMCRILKRELNIETVEEAKAVGETRLLKIRSVGKMFIHKLNKINTEYISKYGNAEGCNMETLTDKILKELVWKLDREVWAHVRNPEPSDEWSTSKAREESKRLITEYIGSVDHERDKVNALIEEIEHLSALRRNDKAWIETLENKLKAVE